MMKPSTPIAELIMEWESVSGEIDRIAKCTDQEMEKSAKREMEERTPIAELIMEWERVSGEIDRVAKCTDQEMEKRAKREMEERKIDRVAKCTDQEMGKRAKREMEEGTDQDHDPTVGEVKEREIDRVAKCTNQEMGERANREMEESTDQDHDPTVCEVKEWKVVQRLLHGSFALQLESLLTSLYEKHIKGYDAELIKGLERASGENNCVAKCTDQEMEESAKSGMEAEREMEVCADPDHDPTVGEVEARKVVQRLLHGSFALQLESMLTSLYEKHIKGYDAELIMDLERASGENNWVAKCID